jgi:hypothetical protein
MRLDMSAPIKDGGPAFPNLGYNKEANYNGMTLRDYFAGQAIVGMLSNVGVDAPNDGTLSKFAMIAAREAKP